jgi:hypothetical protein
VLNRKRGPDRTASVARGRLHPDVLESAVAKNFSVGDAVECDASRKTEVVEAVLARE